MSPALLVPGFDLFLVLAATGCVAVALAGLALAALGWTWPT